MIFNIIIFLIVITILIFVKNILFNSFNTRCFKTKDEKYIIINKDNDKNYFCLKNNKENDCFKLRTKEECDIFSNNFEKEIYRDFLLNNANMEISLYCKNDDYSDKCNYLRI